MKKRILSDVRVVADVSNGMGYMWRSTLEQQAKQMESLASEFNSFVRDHRSMDWVSLHVEKEYQDICSHCENSWEVDSDGIPICCDEAQKEHEELINASKNTITN